jgi:hypothetical protein
MIALFVVHGKCCLQLPQNQSGKQCGAHFTFSEMQASGEIIVEWTATPEQLAAMQSEYKAN